MGLGITWKMLNVIHEPHPLSGVDNMRIDEELLNNAAAREESTLRFYQWSEPTISLGYFQKDMEIPELFADLPAVPRLSGGGAILHHHELTYSLSLARRVSSKKPTAWYRRVHNEIITCLGELGLACALRGAAGSDPGKQTFLCFSRSDPNDIVHAEHKVVGSAQRRRRGAVLQHGSVLLRHSVYSPNHPGLFDLGAQTVNPDTLAQMIEARLVAAFAALEL